MCAARTFQNQNKHKICRSLREGGGSSSGAGALLDLQQDTATENVLITIPPQKHTSSHKMGTKRDNLHCFSESREES